MVKALFTDSDGFASDTLYVETPITVTGTEIARTGASKLKRQQTRDIASTIADTLDDRVEACNGAAVDMHCPAFNETVIRVLADTAVMPLLQPKTQK